MMSARRLTCVVAVLMAALAGGATRAQQSAAGAPDAAKTLTDLQALDHAVESAFQRADADYLKDVLADDFQFFISSGKPLPKAQVLTTYGKPGQFPRRELTSANIELHGDVALSNGRMEVHSAAGRDYVVCYLRLYQRRGERWQLLSHRTFRERDGFTETCAPVDRAPRSQGPAAGGANAPPATGQK
jgi:hypothetical protein